MPTITPPPADPARMILVGAGDDLDLAAGRCCPHCRHDLTAHNVAVWNAGYTVSRRHAQDDIRAAWDAGFSACANEHIAQRADPEHPITRTNPHDPRGGIG